MDKNPKVPRIISDPSRKKLNQYFYSDLFITKRGPAVFPKCLLPTFLILRQIRAHSGTGRGRKARLLETNHSGNLFLMLKTIGKLFCSTY